MTVRIGIIGCGAIARRTHLPALKRHGEVDVIAFASRTDESAQAACNEWGGGSTFTDWRKVLDHPGLDAVDVCSPNAMHRDQAVAAAKAGKHVLVEKPIACTVEEADEMIAAAETSGVVLHVAHNLRYLAPVLAARDLVSSGELGNLTGIRAAFGHAGPRDWSPDATWFFDKKRSGGGALIDMGIHIIDVVRFVTGLEATKVSAMTVGDESVEDTAQVLVRYDNGSVGSVHASWVARPAPDFVLTVFGEKGTLHFDAKTPLTLRRPTGEKTEVELQSVPGDPYSDFVNAVLNQPVEGPIASGSEGRAALAIVCAAYQSADTGETVDIAH